MSVLSATAGKCVLFMQQGETFALHLLGRIQLYTTMCVACVDQFKIRIIINNPLFTLPWVKTDIIMPEQ